MRRTVDGVELELVDQDVVLVQRMAAWSETEGPFGFDVETSGTDIVAPDGSTFPDPGRHRITGFSLAWGSYAFYAPVRHETGDHCVSEKVAWGALRAVCEAAPERRGWAHNWAFELAALRNEQPTLAISDSSKLHDSMVAAWLDGRSVDAKYARQGLDLKSQRVALGLPQRATFEDVARKRQVRDVPVLQIFEYAALDAYDTLAVGESAYASLTSKGLVGHFHSIDMPCVEVLRKMTARGIPLDTATLTAYGDTLQPQVDAVAAEFLALTTHTLACDEVEDVETGAVFKAGPRAGQKKTRKETVRKMRIKGAQVGKDAQVSKWLVDSLKWWPPAEGDKRNDKGYFSVDKDSVERHLASANPKAKRAAELRLEYQKLSKLLSTYIRPMCEFAAQYEDGRLHGSFKLTGTDTQRLSAANPNLQNCPSRSKEGKAIRKALVAPPGWQVGVVDMSQAELRVLAHFSRDPDLSACYFLDVDVHQGTLDKLKAMAPAIDWTRTDAKITNFSSIYGIQAESLAVKMKTTPDRAQMALDAFEGRFANVQGFRDWCESFVVEHGYMKTLDGFHRPLDRKLVWRKDLGKKWLRGRVCNQATNMAIQGTVAGMAKRAMLKVDASWVSDGTDGVTRYLVAQEHDSLVFLARDDVAEASLREVIEAMENFVLRVPFRADGKLGRSWAEAK